jgi:hypothetical protein
LASAGLLARAIARARGTESDGEEWDDEAVGTLLDRVGGLMIKFGDGVT